MNVEKKEKSLEDYLIQKIKESGYPLEIEISNLLDKEYYVFNTQYYFDEEMKQGRDIDINAIPNVMIDAITNEELANKLAPFTLMTEIAVECKRSETYALVFFTRPRALPINLHTSGQYQDKFSQTKVSSLVQSLLFAMVRFHHIDFEEVAIAYDEINVKEDKRTDSKKGIFKGIHQLVKFICYEKRPLSPPDMSKKTYRVTIFFPIIVFDGYMYKANLELERPKLEKVEHILVETNYRSPYTRKVETYLIDVVHRSYFPQFMKKLHTDFSSLINTVLQHHGELVKAAEETSKKYESGEGILMI